MSSINGTLANLFGWLLVIAPLIGAVLGLWLKAPRWTVGVGIVISLIAGAAQYFRMELTAELTARLSRFEMARWEPLTPGESVEFRRLLSAMKPPHQTFQILCAVDGCGELAVSLLQSADKIPGWKVRLVSAHSGASAPDGIELWFRGDLGRSIGEALTKATGGRLTVQYRRFPEAAPDDQINLELGAKR